MLLDLKWREFSEELNSFQGLMTVVPKSYAADVF